MVKKFSLILFSFLFLEIVLQSLAYFSPKVDYLLSREQPQWITDDKLGFRLHPSYPEHDRQGFRNRLIPERACVVALGDSQTYGWKVPAAHAWPQRLGALAQVGVYNMAVPQYGPVHSLLLWDEAMKVHPRFILEGFYVGNDLFDCYDMVYSRGAIPEMKSDNSEVIRSISAAGEFKVDQPSLQSEKREKEATTKDFIAERSKLYGLFRAVKRIYHYNFAQVEEDIHFAKDWTKIRAMAENDDQYFIVDNGTVKTVLDIGWRSKALNPEDPRIAEGLRIAWNVFRRMNHQAKEQKAQLIVVLIPTKELVFKDVVYASIDKVPDTYRTLIEREETIWRNTKQFLQDNRISYIEPLPALRAAFSEKQPYPISANSHTNSFGHEVTAKAILSAVQSDFSDELRACNSE
jgi:hypothetical protein